MEKNKELNNSFRLSIRSKQCRNCIFYNVPSWYEKVQVPKFHGLIIPFKELIKINAMLPGTFARYAHEMVSMRESSKVACSYENEKQERYESA